MTTVASPGYGSNLSYSATGYSGMTRIAQLKTINPDPGEAQTDDIFNLDSPSIAEEVLKTTVKTGKLSLQGVYDGTNAAGYSALLNQLYTAGQAAQGYWQITFTDGSTMQFRGYITKVPITLEVKKAITFSADLMITGAVAFTS
jgi:hypothetical protein